MFCLHVFCDCFVSYAFIFQISSWQIPPEVVEFRQKQDNGVVKTDASVSDSTLLNSKGPTTVSLSAPAVVTGGRDSISLRSVGGVLSSSALDLVKKKLQDAGTASVSSPLSQPSHLASSELNDAKSREVLEKAPQSENCKEKQKDDIKDDNMSDSSSDSDDTNSGPSTEECIIQFKVGTFFFFFCFSMIFLSNIWSSKAEISFIDEISSQL